MRERLDVVVLSILVSLFVAPRPATGIGPDHRARQDAVQRDGNVSSPRGDIVADRYATGKKPFDAFSIAGLVGMGVGAFVGLVYGLAKKSLAKSLLFPLAGGAIGFLVAILAIFVIAILVIALILKALVSSGGSSGGRVIQQDGKTYRRNWLGTWVADKDWLGNAKVDRDWLGRPKIIRDWLGNQKIERDWLGNPMVPPDKKSDRSGCYITTACIQTKRLPDDCMELITLRRFRDSYVRNLPDGDRLIHEYYNISPQIVAAINAEANAAEVYRDLYTRLVWRSIEFIRLDMYDDAFQNYVRIVAELSQRYLSAPQMGRLQLGQPVRHDGMPVHGHNLAELESSTYAGGTQKSRPAQ